MQTSQETRFSIEDLKRAYRAVVTGSNPEASFYIMVALSSIIAAYGLIADSPAVVIGAMLVAPLMTPIQGIALALVANDRGLLRCASRSEVYGVGLSVALAVLIGLASSGVDLNNQILMRTSPTVYDIVVALAAGAAGAYSLVHPNLNASLPGVAIAVSLAPPLAACGLCLAMGRFDLAGGAFLLFFANFLSIQLATGAVFYWSGYPRVPPRLVTQDTTPITVSILARRFSLSVVLLVAVGFYLTQTLHQLVGEKAFARELEDELKAELQRRTGARLTDLRYGREGDTVNAVAVVLTPQEFLPSDIRHVETQVGKLLGEHLSLTVRSILSRDTDAKGPVFLLDEEKHKREQAAAELSLLERATEALRKGMGELPGAALVDVRREESDQRVTFIATVRTPIAIAPVQVAFMEKTLRDALESDARLVVRSVLTRDADADRFLYEASEQAHAEPGLEGAALEFHQELRRVLAHLATETVTSGSLVDVQQETRDGAIAVTATVRAPVAVGPDAVRRMQTVLRQEVDPRIRLMVNTQISATADDRSFVVPETASEGALPSS